MGSTMDLFIDQWLYFLPLPRYSVDYETFTSSLLTDIDYCRCFFLSMKKACIDQSVDPKITASNFIAFWPHITSLRDPKAILINQCYILCLMALDRESCSTLPLKIAYSDKYVTGFKELITSEIGVDISPLTEIQVLQEVHSSLLKAREAQVPALADESWTSYSLAKDRGLTNSDMDLRAALILKQTAETYLVDPIKLEKRLAIKNFVDECPDISFYNNA